MISTINTTMSMNQDQNLPPEDAKIEFITYSNESQLPSIQRLMEADLSEPYSVYTYRYFINNWPKLCWMAMDDGECVGAIVCKVEMTRKFVYQGYIAMLAVSATHRSKGLGMPRLRAYLADAHSLGTLLVERAIQTMAEHGATQTEAINKGALRLYEKLGFVKSKRLYKYYLNGGDAYKLVLSLDFGLSGLEEAALHEAQALQQKALLAVENKIESTSDASSTTQSESTAALAESAATSG